MLECIFETYFLGGGNWITSNLVWLLRMFPSLEHLNNHYSMFSYFSSDLLICLHNLMWLLHVIFLIKYAHCWKFRMRINIFTVQEMYSTSFDYILVSRKRYNWNWLKTSLAMWRYSLSHTFIKLFNVTKYLKLLSALDKTDSVSSFFSRHYNWMTQILHKKWSKYVS